MRTAVALLCLLAASALPAAAREDGKVFKDWVAVCDNTRSCEALGFTVADSPDEDYGAMRLLRSGEAGAAPSLQIIPLMEGFSPAGKPVALLVDGERVLRLPAGQAAEVTLSGGQIATLLSAARDGETLEVMAGERRIAVVSLMGMQAALRYLDDVQKRAGGVTALVAKGPKPASAMAAPPAPPVVRAAAAVSQDGLPDKPPASVLAVRRDAGCEPEAGQEDRDEPFTVARLSGSEMLWRAACGGGAYNTSELFVIVDKAGRLRSPALYGEKDGEPSLATNAEYDPDTRKLHAYAKGRSVGDCGDVTEWVWTGRAFEMTSASGLALCRGYGGDWPVSYRAEVRQ